MRSVILLLLLIISSLFTYAEPKRVYKVGFAQDTMSNDWRVAQVRQMEELFKKQDKIDFFYTDANSITARQIEDIDEMISDKVDVIITSPRDCALFTPILKKAFNAGIPVVLVSRGITDSTVYTSFIHPSNGLIAKQAADTLAECLNMKGSIFILQHTPSTTPATERTEGFLNQIAKYDDIKILGIAVANSIRQEAMYATLEAFKRYDKIDAIYAQSDSMAVGAVAAVLSIGKDPQKMCITGIDYISDARVLIEKGWLKASFVYPTGAKETVEAVLDIINGKKVEKEIIIPVMKVDKSNINKVKPIF